MLGKYAYKWKNKKIQFFIITSIILSIIEFYIHYKINIYRRLDDYYITTIILAFFILVWAIKETPIAENTLISTLATFGKKYSAFIYIIHPSILTIINLAVKSEMIIWKNCIPIITFAISLVIAILFNSLLNCMQCKQKRGLN